MNEQIWMDIVGYEGDYQISNYGQVKSLKNGKEKILSLRQRKDGYLDILLSNNGIQKRHQVHKLVAEHFVPGYREGYVVNHIDEDKSNNVWTNVEWISQKENINHGTRTQMAVQTRQSNKGKSIYCPELDMIFTTQTEASRYIGCSYQLVNKVLLGKLNTAKGHHLEYR